MHTEQQGREVSRCPRWVQECNCARLAWSSQTAVARCSQEQGVCARRMQLAGCGLRARAISVALQEQGRRLRCACWHARAQCTPDVQPKQTRCEQRVCGRVKRTTQRCVDDDRAGGWHDVRADDADEQRRLRKCRQSKKCAGWGTGAAGVRGGQTLDTTSPTGEPLSGSRDECAPGRAQVGRAPL